MVKIGCLQLEKKSKLKRATNSLPQSANRRGKQKKVREITVGILEGVQNQ